MTWVAVSGGNLTVEGTAYGTGSGPAVTVTCTGADIVRESRTKYKIKFYFDCKSSSSNNYNLSVWSSMLGGHTIYSTGGSWSGTVQGETGYVYWSSDRYDGSAFDDTWSSIEVYSHDWDYRVGGSSAYLSIKYQVPEWTHYSITYNANGGSGAPSEGKKYKDTSYTISNTKPTWNGHTFLGWSTTKRNPLDYGSSLPAGDYASGATYTGNAGLSLYAVWYVNKYVISFDKKSGTGTADSTQITPGDGYGTLPTLTRTGYTFGGWYSSVLKKTVLSTDKPTQSETLTAQWSANTYTITLNKQDGTGGTASVSITYATTTLSSITVPTKTGYTFGGYYTSMNGGGTQRITAAGAWTGVTNTTFTGNTTLYAKWTPNIYKVTLNNQGATTAGTGEYYYKYKTAGGNSIYYYSDAACKNGISGSIFTAPTKTGYTFGGYYTSTNGGGTQYVTSAGVATNSIYSSVAGNTTLYAKWTAKTYTITLNSKLDGVNATTAGTASVSITYATTTLSSITIPTRTGYSFGGYYTGENGSGTQRINSNGAWVADNKTFTDHTTLFAKWTVISPTSSLTVNSRRIIDDGDLGVVDISYSVSDCYGGANLIVTISDGDGEGRIYGPYDSLESAIEGANSETVFSGTSIDSVRLSKYSSSQQNISDRGEVYFALKNLDTDYQYKIVASIEPKNVKEQKAGDTIKTDYISKSLFTMDFLAGGTGIAIGTPSSSSGFINNMETGVFKGFSIYPEQYNETKIATGGRNLLVATPKEIRLKTPTNTDDTHTAYYNCSDYGAALFGTSVTKQFTVYFKYEIYSDEQYTILKNDILSDSDKFQIWCQMNGFIVSANPSGQSTQLNLNKKNSGEYRVTFSQTQTQASGNKRFRIRVKNLSAKDYYFKLFDFKVEEGPSASSWTPAPEDAALLLVDNTNGVIANSTIKTSENITVDKSGLTSPGEADIFCKNKAGSILFWSANSNTGTRGVWAINAAGDPHSVITLNQSNRITNHADFQSNYGPSCLDSSGTSYPMIVDNGTNLWIGTSSSTTYHHKGKTFISTGYTGNVSDGSVAGNSSIYISKPVYDPSGKTWNHNGYLALHAGNYNSYALPLSGGTLTGNITVNSTTDTTMSIKAKNSNGTVVLNASSNRGIYDETLSHWIIATQKSDGHVCTQDFTSTSNKLAPIAYYPVGAVYISYNSTSPASLFGGTWTQLKNVVLRAAENVNAGGSDTHTLTQAQLPVVSGSFNIRKMSFSSTSYATYSATGTFSEGGDVTSEDFDTIEQNDQDRYTRKISFKFGSGNSHNNLPSYQNLYVWHRTG